MKNIFTNDLSINTIVIILLVAMILFHFLGYKAKYYLLQKNKIDAHDGFGTVEGALLGLFAFFLGFTFSMSGDRYDNRRATIVDEANAIGTAILRTDLYPDSISKEFKNDFKTYLDIRLSYFKAGTRENKLKSTLDSTSIIGDSIWKRATDLSKNGNFDAASRQMIPALNDMIDAVTTRDAAKNAKVPVTIVYVLFILSVFSSFIIGYGTTGKLLNGFIGYIFIVMVTASVYLILDLDSPRHGLISTEKANHKMIELRSLLD